jgi:3-oxoacyl-[acyl-carrier protein] reductase
MEELKKNSEKRNELFNIKNKIIIITGGIGRLGTELSTTLLDQGAIVIIVDLNKSENKEKEEILKEKFSENCFFFECDISKQDQVKKLKNFILEKFNRLDVLINCAGVGVYTPFEERSEEELDHVINVNIKGTINCSRILGEIMKNQKEGHIINIGSIYGMVSSDKKIYGSSKRNNSEIYSMTKASIIMLTKYLAAYWAPHNIRVNCISPGGIINEKKVELKDYMEFTERYGQKTFLNRMGKTSEFKGIITYLVSDASSYMTGSNIVIDGGFTSW